MARRLMLCGACLLAGSASAESVSGRVTTTSTSPLPTQFSVQAYIWQNGILNMVASAAVSPDGTYVLSNLAPRGYVLVVAGGPFGNYWVSERWPEVRCSAIDRASCFPVNETQLQLQPGADAKGIDFTPELGGVLGASFQPAGNNPSDFSVLALTAPGSPFYSPWAEVVGSTFHGAAIPAGTYYLVGLRRDQPDIHWQAWRGRDCPSGDPQSCDLRYAQPIVVTPGSGGGAVFDFRTRDTVIVDGFEAPLTTNAAGDSVH